MKSETTNTEFSQNLLFVLIWSKQNQSYPKITLETIRPLESRIDVAPGTFGKNIKHSPLKKHIPLHKMIDFQTFLWFTLFNKDVAPGKNSKN